MYRWFNATDIRKHAMARGAFNMSGNKVASVVHIGAPVTFFESFLCRETCSTQPSLRL